MKLTLKALRVNAGFTIEKASKELGISTVTLRSYETNKTIPTVKMMNKMLSLYNAKFSNIDDSFLDHLAEIHNSLVVKARSIANPTIPLEDARQTFKATSDYQSAKEELLESFGAIHCWVGGMSEKED